MLDPSTLTRLLLPFQSLLANRNHVDWREDLRFLLVFLRDNDCPVPELDELPNTFSLQLTGKPRITRHLPSGLISSFDLQLSILCSHPADIYQARLVIHLNQSSLTYEDISITLSPS